MKSLATIEEIKEAIDAGKEVKCMGGSYTVIKDSIGQYLIVCDFNGHTVGLHGREGTVYERKLNGSEFYVESST